MDRAIAAREDDVLTISEASAALGVSRETVYRLIKDGKLQVKERPYLKRARFTVYAASVESLKREVKG